MNYLFIFYIVVVISLIFLFYFFYFFVVKENINIKNNNKIYYKLKPDNKMDIFIVSLKNRQKRREDLLKRVIPTEIFAVDGSKLNLEKMIKKGEIKNKKLKKGEIGCYLSHYYFILKSLDTNKKILLFEDDADFENININKILKEVPKDFEILLLGCNYFETKNKKDKDSNKKYIEVKLIHGTQSYIINNNISLDKVNKLFPIKYPIDITLPKIFKTYVINPKIVNTRKFVSDTQNII